MPIAIFFAKPQNPTPKIMNILVSILINGLLVYFSARLLEGVYIDGYLTAVFAALILGLINLTIKPIMTFLTLPVTILTFGLFLLVINGISVWLASIIVPGFAVSGLLWAIIFSIVLAIFNYLTQGIFDTRKKF